MHKVQTGGRDDYPSVKNQRFLPAPQTRGAFFFYAFLRYLISAEAVETIHTRSVKKAVEPTIAV